MEQVQVNIFQSNTYKWSQAQGRPNQSNLSQMLCRTPISGKAAHAGSPVLFCHITDWIADCEPEYMNKSLAFPIILTDNTKQGQKKKKSLEPFLTKLCYQPIMTNNSDLIGPPWCWSEKQF